MSSSLLLQQCPREKFKQIDLRTRKLMTMHKALHPRDDVNRLYVSRKEGERGQASIKNSVDASMQQLEDRKARRKTDRSHRKQH